jgi:hypothetical protein
MTYPAAALAERQAGLCHHALNGQKPMAARVLHRPHLQRGLLHLRPLFATLLEAGEGRNRTDVMGVAGKLPEAADFAGFFDLLHSPPVFASLTEGGEGRNRTDAIGLLFFMRFIMDFTQRNGVARVAVCYTTLLHFRHGLALSPRTLPLLAAAHPH